MEWLSAEEKSRSMMPYLLDLPPLDQTESDAAKAEISSDASITKKATQKKGTVKDIDMEKWHSDTIICDLDRKPDLPSASSRSDANKINCDTKHKYLVDLKISNSKNFIALTDHDMAILCRLAQELMKKSL